MFRTTTLILALLALSSGALLAQKKGVTSPSLPPSANFSHGILAGDTLYVSGQVGRGADGKRPESFEDEVKATFGSIEGILKAGGMGFEDVVQVNVYLTDMTLFDRMNKVYVTFLPEPRPTRTTVGVSSLVGNYRIEITVTARKAGAGGGARQRERRKN
ncbi:MAG: RidA family protein [Bryobacteraceae bacterium]|nr:RidA family protein [Bryobacteraceae bacterium]